ncbi:hypothetical protein DL96DRAFT_1624136 [Flagelloscypha sp. PMI_526]|nr:hypothetical protein DL96DRAFT_1624136 [Flagelloscypha sp. PMI_526]
MFLIAPLIPASSLIAVLDTSHSQRLLDLSHYRCNRVSSRFTNMHRSAQRKASEAKLSITSQLHRIPALQHTPAQPVSPQASIDQGFPRDRSRSHRATDHEFCDGMCHRVSTRNQPSVVCISAGPDTLVDPKLSMTSVLVDVLSKFVTSLLD